MKKTLTGLGSSLVLCITLTGCGDGGGSSSVAPDTVVVSSTPASPVSSKIGVSTPVAVTFTTSDNSSLANNKFQITGLSALPTGWTQTGNTCSSLNATASSCQVSFAFAPTNTDNGNLNLNYSYVNNKNTLTQQTFAIAYSGTINNNAVMTVSPSAPLRAIAGMGHSYPVTVNFTTDDGNAATNLTIPSTILPTGWKFTNAPSASTPLCSEFGSNKPCSLKLTYTPQTRNIVPFSTLNIPFNYTSDGNEPKTGNVTYTYSAGTDDAVVANVTPSNALNTHININQTTTLKFTTNDQNTASGLSLKLPTPVPAGWNISSSNCATVPSQNSGNACTMTLTYTPTQTGESGTLSLPYAYSKNDGQPGSGLISIPYNSLPAIYAYVVDQQNQNIQRCMINTNGVFSIGCQGVTASNGISSPTNIAFQTVSNGDYVYIANVNNSDTVKYCQVDPSNAVFGSCNDFAYGGFVNPDTINFHKNNSNNITYAYISNHNTNSSGQYAIFACALNPTTGALVSPCTQASSSSSSIFDITFQTIQSVPYAYIIGNNNEPIQYCKVDEANNTFTNCQTSTNPTFFTSASIAFQTINSNLYAYITGNAQNSSVSEVMQCKVNSDGSLTSCINAGGNGFFNPTKIAFQTLGNDPSIAQTYVYTTNQHSVIQCLVDPNSGTFSSCATSNGTFLDPIDIALHYYSF